MFLFFYKKKLSVLWRMIWRTSNLFVQFKSNTNHFKNMKKCCYWGDRPALLTYISSTLSSDIIFSVLFRIQAHRYRFKKWLDPITWKKDRPKSSSDRKRGRNDRHERRKYAHPVDSVEYDSRFMNHSITFLAELSFTFCSIERFRVSHPAMYIVNFINQSEMKSESQIEI